MKGLMLCIALMLFANCGSPQQRLVERSEKESRANPNSPEKHCELGKAYLQSGGSPNVEKAIHAFEQAIRLRYDYPEAHYQLGIAYHKLHTMQVKQPHPQEEIEALKTAIEQRPDYVDAYVSLGHASMPTDGSLDRLGALRQAEALFRKALEINRGFIDAYDGLTS
ncbi:MAG: tetratricopeptide repeat protein, partial [Blastocatellia bacterium]